MRACRPASEGALVAATVGRCGKAPADTALHNAGDAPWVRARAPQDARAPSLVSIEAARRAGDEPACDTSAASPPRAMRPLLDTLPGVDQCMVPLTLSSCNTLHSGVVPTTNHAGARVAAAVIARSRRENVCQRGFRAQPPAVGVSAAAVLPYFMAGDAPQTGAAAHAQGAHVPVTVGCSLIDPPPQLHTGAGSLRSDGVGAGAWAPPLLASLSQLQLSYRQLLPSNVPPVSFADKPQCVYSSLDSIAIAAAGRACNMGFAQGHSHAVDTGGTAAARRIVLVAFGLDDTDSLMPEDATEEPEAVVAGGAHAPMELQQQQQQQQQHFPCAHGAGPQSRLLEEELESLMHDAKHGAGAEVGGSVGGDSGARAVVNVTGGTQLKCAQSIGERARALLFGCFGP